MANEAKQFTIGGVTHDVMDAGARQLIADLQAAIDAITSGDTTAAIKTFQEVINFLDGVTDDETLAGKLNELRTLLNGKVDNVDGMGLSTNDFTAALLEKLNALPDAEQYEKDIADAGKVKTVSVNGTPATPDQNGNVNINVQSGAQGNDGITPHIDALTGNWFIGETDTHVKAQGEQGNSGVSSADEVAVVNNLDGEPDNLESGKVAVLSANMGKFIGDRCIPLSGTFADAYDKAKVLNAVFPWMLIDEDENGNPVKKMMWHVGNKEFVDAIGGKVDGTKNGLTIVSTAPGFVRLWQSTNLGNNNNSNSWMDYPIIAGETNYSFDELLPHEGVTSFGNDKWHLVEFVNTEKTTLLTSEIKYVNFGGMTINYNHDPQGRQTHGNIYSRVEPFYGYSSVKKIKNLNLNVVQEISTFGALFYGCSSLEEISISGEIKGKAGNSYIAQLTGWFNGCGNLIKCDLSKLKCKFSIAINWFGASPNLEFLDIRLFDFSVATNVSNFIRGVGLKTIIVGDISIPSNATTTNFMGSVTGATLVCTTDTPPALNIDFISGHFTSIKVPNKTVDVEGTPTAVIDLYKAATGWSTYEGIMSTYEEGEY